MIKKTYKFSSYSFFLFCLFACAGVQSQSIETENHNYQVKAQVSACANLGTGSEHCEWVLEYNKAKCSREKKCPKLVVFFSGGQMSCPELNNKYSYLRDYADRGYIGICVKLFKSGSENSKWPRHKLLSRVSTSIEDIKSSETLKSLWTGDELLFSGVSEGATVPLLAMIQTSANKRISWKGKYKTAACFFDGIPHVPSFLKFIEQHSCFANDDLVNCGRQIKRYGCQSGENSCDCESPDVLKDSVLAYPNLTSKMDISDWMLIECGSGFRRKKCSRDATPAAPIAELCKTINSSDRHKCQFKKLPFRRHAGCSITKSNLCMNFFDSL